MDNVQRTGPKDVFVQLLLMVALYLSATHLGTLLFQIVNHYVPDPAAPTWSREIAGASIRWAIAMLIVAAPVFFGVTWHLRREFERTPEKLQLRSRRWLTALTLFVAALIAIGDLVTVVHTFLQGELTLRFVLKALVVLVIAGAVLWYERWEFRRTSGGRLPANILALRWGAIVVTAVAIVTGFVITGSPWRARYGRLDADRVHNLQSIQRNIVTYWQLKTQLPASLDALRDDVRGYVVPVDPTTGASYEYRAIGERQFELCATFQTDTKKGGAVRSTSRRYAPDDTWEGWQHGTGRTCFTRTIDPDRYPPKKAPATPPPPPPPIDIDDVVPVD
jgi:hypothetical protein